MAPACTFLNWLDIASLVAPHKHGCCSPTARFAAAECDTASTTTTVRTYAPGVVGVDAEKSSWDLPFGLHKPVRALNPCPSILLTNTWARRLSPADEMHTCCSRRGMTVAGGSQAQTNPDGTDPAGRVGTLGQLQTHTEPGSRCEEQVFFGQKLGWSKPKRTGLYPFIAAYARSRREPGADPYGGLSAATRSEPPVLSSRGEE